MKICTVLDHCIVFVWIYLINIQSVVGVLPYSISQKTSGYRSKGCPAGKYYDEETYERGKCRKCVVCPKGYTEFSSCSTTTNRSCKPCKIGTTFSDNRGGICRNCTDCERGQFVRRQCLPYRDARCKNCPNGTYSLDGKGFGCKYCSVCKEHEEEVSPCTSLQNRECSLKEDYTLGNTNHWNTGPEYNKDFSFSTRLVLLSLLIAMFPKLFGL
ncbi:TNR16-like protein [Mya arenaria]|uniref:TNR16-like protein n=1 Tax=Mya arenaria TaxID=6604 RepID=A0ABY7FH85_MYAAR|nr:TNR16-like protein [Mya arenaria]